MFQSHLGSILPLPDTERRYRRLSVSIPPWFDFAADVGGGFPDLVVFQSHLGSILPRARIGLRLCGDGFNPTLVRFCHVCGGYDRLAGEQFQSHLGSILPSLTASVTPSIVEFQSHLGSILPTQLMQQQAVEQQFQSHLGSILPRT